jgi:hypothetical protein
MSYELRTVVEDLHFSECPRRRDDRLFFSDFLAHHRRAAKEGRLLATTAEVPHGGLP